MHCLFYTLHHNSERQLSIHDYEMNVGGRIHTERGIIHVKLIIERKRGRTHPDIDLPGNSEEINDVRDKCITAPDVEYSG